MHKSTPNKSMSTPAPLLRRDKVIVTDKIVTSDMSDDSDGEATPVPKKVMINQYVILDQVGKGKHGVVKTCYSNNEPDTILAIKIVPRDTKEAQNARKMQLLRMKNKFPKSNVPPPVDKVHTIENNIRREIAIMRKTNHMNVVKLLEVIDDRASKSIYMIMEYLGGGEIQWRNYNKEPVLSVNQSRRIFRDAILGLEYLHFHGIIHRDIKPSNLIWSENRAHVKIADFGVAHCLAATDSTTLGEDDYSFSFSGTDYLAIRAGTPPFMAPEVVAEYFNEQPQENEITNSIDIWALGITLYCFLFAKLPFAPSEEEQENMNDIAAQSATFRKICNEEWPRHTRMGSDRKRSSSEEHVMQLLRRCLDKKYKTRITLSEIKKSPWFTDEVAQPDVWRQETSPGRIQVSEQETNEAIRKIKFRWGNIIFKFLRPSTSREGGLLAKERVDASSQTSSMISYRSSRRQHEKRRKKVASNSRSLVSPAEYSPTEHTHPSSSRQITSKESFTPYTTSAYNPYARRGSAATVDVVPSSKFNHGSTSNASLGGSFKNFLMRSKQKQSLAPPAQAPESSRRPLARSAVVSNPSDNHRNELLLCKSEEILSSSMQGMSPPRADRAADGHHLSPLDGDLLKSPRRISSYHDQPGEGPSTAFDSDIDDFLPEARVVKSNFKTSRPAKINVATSTSGDEFPSSSISPSTEPGSGSVGSSLGQLLSSSRIVMGGRVQSNYDNYDPSDGGSIDRALEDDENDGADQGDDYDDASSAESALIMRTKSSKLQSSGEAGSSLKG